jgi:hypothetical protein
MHVVYQLEGFNTKISVTSVLVLLNYEHALCMLGFLRKVLCMLLG